jgi:hypothetical protein
MMTSDEIAAKATTNFERTARLMQCLPFDMAREQYGIAVQMGLLQRSMLAWARFERHMDRLEKATLGPWARRV